VRHGLPSPTHIPPRPANGLRRVSTPPSNPPRTPAEFSPGETATVGVWIESGTRFETEENNGTAHFLEHMAFKGTQKRSKAALELEVENMGAHLNAYTSREQTVYYAKVFQKDVAQAVDILSDILQNSQLDEKAIERERSVILREEEEVAKSEEEVTFDRLHSMAYQGTPLNRLILGSRDNIARITRDDLQQYINTHYTAPRCVLVGAGAIDHDELCELGAKAFEGLPSENADAVRKEIELNPSYFTGSEVRNREDDMPLAHVAFAWEAPSWTHGDSVPMMVFHALLGSWDRSSMVGSSVMSRMCARAAEMEGTHKVSTFNTVYSDTSLFGVYYVAEPKGIDDVQWALQYEIARCCFQVEEDQLERAKATLKTNLLLSLDDTSQIAEDIGRQVLCYGRRVPIDEMFARIDAVDESTVMRVASEYVFDREMAVSSMGPVGYLPDYNWMRRRTYWTRF
jgi:processing peptidase subunit beta